MEHRLHFSHPGFVTLRLTLLSWISLSLIYSRSISPKAIWLDIAVRGVVTGVHESGGHCHGII
jgi:hypothetical protein